MRQVGKYWADGSENPLWLFVEILLFERGGAVISNRLFGADWLRFIRNDGEGEQLLGLLMCFGKSHHVQNAVGIQEAQCEEQTPVHPVELQGCRIHSGQETRSHSKHEYREKQL